MERPTPGRLCRKQIAAHYGVGRTTVWRWEREGLHLHHGGATVRELEWFHLQRDLAKREKIPVKTFFAMPLATRIDLVWAKHEDAAVKHFETPAPATIG